MSSSAPSSRRLSAEELAARLDELLFASPSHRSTQRLAEGLEALTRAQQEHVLHWVGVAAQSYVEAGYLVAARAAQVLARLGQAGFEAWVLDGLDAYDRSGGQAALARLRDLDGFCAARDERAVRLSEVEGTLARFLRGLSGRPLALAAGHRAYTDTETVFLPQRLARLPRAEDNRRLYKAMAALAWAQTRYGTFGSAAVDVGAALARWPQRERALAWFAVLEAVRLEAVLGAELPGLAAEIAQLRGPWPAALEAAVAGLAHPEATVSQTLTFLDRCMAGGADPPVLPHAAAIDLEAALAVRAARISRATEVVRRALSSLKIVGARQQAGAQTVAVILADGRLALGVDGEALALPPEAQAAAQSLVQDLGQLPPQCLAPAGPGPWQPAATAAEGGQSPTAGEPLARYDEWDWRRGAYRRGWCHLHEVALTAGDPACVAAIRQRHAAAIRQVRRRFELLRGEARLLGRQAEGEEIDLDACIEAAAERGGAAEWPTRLYVRRVRRERSLAAMFMVDMSGSTKGWVVEAEREALVMLCEALERLGDAYAIYGFSGWTRTRCEVYPVKRFGEAYDETVRGRIAAIEARDYTRMGVAVRHLTRLLREQPARHRLLVTLSDGRPDDFGDEYRGRYGIEDTRRALQEAHAAGVRSFCITLDRHGADYLPQLYGPARYVVIDDARKLPHKVAEIYRRLAA